MNLRKTKSVSLNKYLAVPRPALVKAAAALLLFSIVSSLAQTPTLPVGYCTLKALAGTGTVKKITALSAPFYNSSSAPITGTLSGVTANTISNASANWTAGQLSTPSSPYIIKITSGAALGRTFLISTTTANTASTVTIDSRDAAQVNLTTLGIGVGDAYEIYRCYTLVGLFGTPSTTGVLGGSTVNNGDTLMISSNGLLETYFYSTTFNRWTKSILGGPDGTYTPIRPDTGILYSRMAATDLVVTIPGRVSTTSRVAMVKNSGTTILAQSWPVNITLVDSKIQLVPNWTASSSVDTADKVKVVTNGVSVTYWFDGANWRKQTVGSPIADSDPIPAGSAVTLDQLGTQTGYSPLTQPLPSYNLN